MRNLKGTSASQGIALGKVLLSSPTISVEAESYFSAGEEQEQVEKYRTAVRMAQEELDTLIQEGTSFFPERTAIVAAHKEMLIDEEVVKDIESMIVNEYALPAYAVSTIYNRFVELLSNVPDALIASRADDLRDVRNRLVRILNNKSEIALANLSEPVIIVTQELLPSQIASFDRQNVLGIVTEIGNANTSHTAIIARSYQLPVIMGVEDATKILRDGDVIVVDAISENIVVNPDVDEINIYQKKMADYQQDQQEANEYLKRPSLTASGEKIYIGLNINSAHSSEGYQYCDFVGLVRTEFLYMAKDHLPTEDQQFNAYRKLLINAKGKPVTLRTLDIGGDKPLSYLPIIREDNPFLGNRGVRICFGNPELFQTQLHAALRASAYGELQIMFPMVSSIEDLRKAKSLLEETKTDLRKRSVIFDENIQIGVMIETPSIALIADRVVKEVDFASIGTNDLSQYLHAADRMNPLVADYYQSMSPAMFRLLAMVFRAFDRAGTPISICGELAGNPIGALALVGLGARKLSMEVVNTVRVKKMLSKFTMTEMESIGQRIQDMDTQNEIVQYLNSEVEKHR